MSFCQNCGSSPDPYPLPCPGCKMHDHQRLERERSEAIERGEIHISEQTQVQRNLGMMNFGKEVKW